MSAPPAAFDRYLAALPAMSMIAAKLRQTISIAAGAHHGSHEWHGFRVGILSTSLSFGHANPKIMSNANADNLRAP